MAKYNSLIMNDNYNKYLESVQKVIDNYDLSDKGIDITSAPMSPMMMDSNDIPVLFMPNVIEEYKKIVDQLNNSNAEMREHAYIMLGRQGRLDKEDIYSVYQIVDCNDDAIDRKSVFDTLKLTDALKIMQDNDFNFISLLRTNVKNKVVDFDKSLDNYISDELKNKEFIRDDSLNITLYDINLYERSIYDYFKNYSDVTACSTVLMPNGELAMFGIHDGKLFRYTNLIDVSTAMNIKVSNKEEYLTANMIA